MIKVKLADFNIHIDNKYEHIEKMCKNYLFEGEADLVVSVTESEIRREETEEITDKGYLETLAVYRKIAEWLPRQNAFLMHGAVMDIDGVGVALLAKSGVGKTTHMRNLKRLLGERLKVVNGDKPLIRLVDGELFAYGTPWSGKERLNNNMKTPLKKIFFVERAKESECIAYDGDILKALLPQIYRPADTKAFVKTLELVDEVIKKTEFYLAKCTPDEASANATYEKIKA